MKQSSIAGLVIALIGVGLSFFPVQLWTLTEKWKSDSAAAPSEKYMKTMRVVGGAFLGLGVLLAAGILQ